MAQVLACATRSLKRGGVLWFACALAVLAMAPAQATEVVLHNFTPAPRGANPGAGLIRDSRGNLYGTTVSGGRGNAGVVYAVDATGHEAVLYRFMGGADGARPNSSVTGDSAGNLYGTTLLGGEWNAGVVYKLDPTGHETVLHSFPQNDGWACSPSPGVIRDSEGNLYGTVPACLQSNAAGLVYKIDTANNWTVLYSFTGGADGGSPKAGVIRDSAGNLYGTTASGGDSTACNGYGCGVVYKLDATGHETVLYSFKGGADGVGPGGVIRDSAGNLYGTTGSGGTGNAGVVYKLDKTGHETVLYSFSSQTNGEYPSAVIRDAAGNLYGTAQCGGTSGSGMVYKLGPSGNLTVLYNGEYSSAGVIRDSAGNLYGTTQYGGTAGLGVVYKLNAT
jgi:uncharacterized repeat protein (TIGR03803 family)